MTKHFADFYDQVSDKIAAKERAENVLFYINKYHPKAETVLELGTGNGNVLASFPKNYKLNGLDIEKKFIKLTKEKVPNANLFVSSMHNFKINKTFDVIFSIYDSVNFLKNFEEWKSLFKTVHKHLNVNGLFIFDMYTPLILEKANGNTNFYKKPFGYMVDLGIVKGNKLTWDFKIFEKKKNNSYELHQIYFHENVFPIEAIENELMKYFNIIERVDGSNLDIPNEESLRLLYTCRKKQI